MRCACQVGKHDKGGIQPTGVSFNMNHLGRGDDGLLLQAFADTAHRCQLSDAVNAKDRIHLLPKGRHALANLLWLLDHIAPPRRCCRHPIDPVRAIGDANELEGGYIVVEGLTKNICQLLVSDHTSFIQSAFNTASTCVLLTPGNQARNSSIVAPSRRFSKRAETGTRVSRKTQAPPSFSGLRSISSSISHCFMLVAFFISVMINEF